MASESKPVGSGDAAPMSDSAGVPPAGDIAGASPTVDASEAGASHSFDQEFRRLHNVLANHGPHALRAVDTDGPRDAKELEGWMRRVDHTLSRLRKRRSKRGNTTR